MLLFPWLCVGGTEVVNNQRTLTYLRQGLGGAVEQIGITDASLDPSDPAALAAYCSHTADIAYVDPATDDAPWYDGTRAESEDFLGILADVEITSVVRRDINDLTRGGAQIGEFVPRSRVVDVAGYLVAASDAGLNYGARWLDEVLAARDVDECRGVDLDLLQFCDADAFRQLLSAGVDDVPRVVPLTSPRMCQLAKLSFQLVGGNPYLFSRGTVCTSAVVLAPGASTCCHIEAPAWLGDVTTKVEVAGSGAAETGPVTVTLTPTDEDTCPDDARAAYSTMEILGIARGGRVVIDSRREEVEVYDVLSRTLKPGFSSIDFNAITPRWLTVGPCTKACLCVANSSDSPGSVTVTITTYLKEL